MTDYATTADARYAAARARGEAYMNDEPTTACGAAIVRSWDGDPRTFVCDRERGHAGAHVQHATDDDLEIGCAAWEWQEEHNATLKAWKSTRSGSGMLFSDRCSCGWIGEAQPTAGLAHAAHDAHAADNAGR